MEQTADHLAAGKQALDGPPVRADDPGLVVNLQGAEGKGDATRGGIGQKGRLIQARGPVAFVRLQPGAGQTVLLRRIETVVGAGRGHGGVVVLQGAQSLGLVVDVQLFHQPGQGIGDDGVGGTVTRLQQMHRLLIEDLP